MSVSTSAVGKEILRDATTGKINLQQFDEAVLLFYQGAIANRKSVLGAYAKGDGFEAFMEGLEETPEILRIKARQAQLQERAKTDIPAGLAQLEIDQKLYWAAADQPAGAQPLHTLSEQEFNSPQRQIVRALTDAGATTPVDLEDVLELRGRAVQAIAAGQRAVNGRNRA